MTRLGYGVVSYFGLIRSFLLIFMLITLINVPVMYFNAEGTALDSVGQVSWMARYPLGNLG